MARKIKKFEFRAPGPGRPAKYPWDNWCDGSIWRVHYGKDFDCTPYGFAMSVYRQAFLRGAKAHVSYNDDTVTFQIVKD